MKNQCTSSSQGTDAKSNVLPSYGDIKIHVQSQYLPGVHGAAWCWNQAGSRSLVVQECSSEVFFMQKDS